MSQLNVNVIKSQTGNGGPTLQGLTVTQGFNSCGVRFISAPTAEC